MAYTPNPPAITQYIIWTMRILILSSSFCNLLSLSTINTYNSNNTIIMILKYIISWYKPWHYITKLPYFIRNNKLNTPCNTSCKQNCRKSRYVFFKLNRRFNWIWKQNNQRNYNSHKCHITVAYYNSNNSRYYCNIIEYLLSCLFLPCNMQQLQ